MMDFNNLLSIGFVANIIVTAAALNIFYQNQQTRTAYRKNSRVFNTITKLIKWTKHNFTHKVANVI